MATREQALGFIKEIAPIVQDVCKSRDKWILPSVAIAQAACESNWGTSKAMAAANGLFGFKVGKGIKYGDGWKGKSYSTKTKEFYNGYVTITDNFRAYDSVRDAVVDYMDLLCSLSRYKAAANETNAQKCITAIKNGGYCTSPTYIATIMSIIRTYNLTQYDSAVKLQVSGTLYAAVAGFCNTAAECQAFQKQLQAAGMITQVWEVKPVKNIS
uniref:Muramidase (Flagellum-specific) n=1 Tax=Myoviridae sp. ct2Qy24 TaxID=2827656 RepID=A0A8S5SSE1_9CAUD|nr:MAG TPA: Muramidase (flagellum-specific) [Myoviridae sp. ct2Qy24]